MWRFEIQAGPAHRFLLEALQNRGQTGRFPESPETSGLLALAAAHNAIPLLHRYLSPPPKELAAQAQAIARRNLALTAELLELLDLFHRNGLTAVPIKGPLLASSAYGSLAARSFEDLDLLIRRRDLPRAVALVSQRGYRPLYGDASAIHLRTEYHYPFALPERDFFIELHAEVAPYYFALDLPLDELFSRLEHVPLAGRTVSSLRPEDTLLLLAVHGVKHVWGSLDHVAGIALLVRSRPDLDWTCLWDRAGRLGARRILLLGLGLAHHLLGLPLPDSIQAALRADNAALEPLARESVRRLLQGRPDAPAFVSTPGFHLRCRERFRDRLRYCLRTCAPNSEELRWCPLPRPLFPLYWGLRPVRMLSSYVPRLLKWRP